MGPQQDDPTARSCRTSSSSYSKCSKPSRMQRARTVFFFANSKINGKIWRKTVLKFFLTPCGDWSFSGRTFALQFSTWTPGSVMICACLKLPLAAPSCEVLKRWPWAKSASKLISSVTLRDPGATLEIRDWKLQCNRCRRKELMLLSGTGWRYMSPGACQSTNLASHLTTPWYPLVLWSCVKVHHIDHLDHHPVLISLFYDVKLTRPLLHFVTIVTKRFVPCWSPEAAPLEVQAIHDRSTNQGDWGGQAGLLSAPWLGWWMETGSLEAVEVVAQHGVTRQMGMVVANVDQLRELPMGISLGTSQLDMKDIRILVPSGQTWFVNSSK